MGSLPAEALPALLGGIGHIFLYLADRVRELMEQDVADLGSPYVLGLPPCTQVGLAFSVTPPPLGWFVLRNALKIARLELPIPRGAGRSKDGNPPQLAWPNTLHEQSLVPSRWLLHGRW